MLQIVTPVVLVLVGMTVITNDVVVAHCPTAGVNVYVIIPGVAVLIVDGLHVPVILLIDVTGNEGAIEF